MKDYLRILLFILPVTFFSCKKDNNAGGNTLPPPSGSELSYGDSIFYIKNQSTDYIVLPTQTRIGQYSGFPEGIDIDQNTGAINISKSETGLRYRISFVPQGSADSIHTTIVISGINFLDGFYKLTTADSIIRPVYNATISNPIPGVNNGTAFDIGSGCNTAGCNVNVAAGFINLAQTVRNGVFGATPANNDRHEFDLNYEINDKSGKAPNTIRVKLYYFNSIADVTPEVYDIISSREGAILGIQPKSIPFAVFTSTNSTNSQTAVLGTALPKPRPPCIFILGR
jgi:hypothetical protein